MNYYTLTFGNHADNGESVILASQTVITVSDTDEIDMITKGIVSSCHFWTGYVWKQVDSPAGMFQLIKVATPVAIHGVYRASLQVIDVSSSGIFEDDPQVVTDLRNLKWPTGFMAYNSFISMV